MSGWWVGWRRHARRLRAAPYTPPLRSTVAAAAEQQSTSCSLRELRFLYILPSGFFPVDLRRAEFRRQCVVVRLAWLLALTALIPSSKKDRFLCARDGIGVAGSACCWPCRARAAWAKRSEAGGAAGVSSLRTSVFRGCLQSSPFPLVKIFFLFPRSFH